MTWHAGSRPENLGFTTAILESGTWKNKTKPIIVDQRETQCSSGRRTPVRAMDACARVLRLSFVADRSKPRSRRIGATATLDSCHVSHILSHLVRVCLLDVQKNSRMWKPRQVTPRPSFSWPVFCSSAFCLRSLEELSSLSTWSVSSTQLTCPSSPWTRATMTWHNGWPTGWSFPFSALSKVFWVSWLEWFRSTLGSRLASSFGCTTPKLWEPRLSMNKDCDPCCCHIWKRGPMPKRLSK